MDVTTPSPMDVNCTYSGEESVICNGTLYSLPEMPLTYTDTWFWVFIGIYVGLVLFAGKDLCNIHENYYCNHYI